MFVVYFGDAEHLQQNFPTNRLFSGKNKIHINLLFANLAQRVVKISSVNKQLSRAQVS